jgi:altronate hydrolase
MIELTQKRVAGPIIRLHPGDNVVVARMDVGIGTPVPSEGFTSRSQVPAGHKLAARAIAAGEAILKYNTCIGFAAVDIPAGTYVHSHNVTFREFDRDYAYGREYVPTPVLPESEQAKFMGYVRADGEVGTRNYIGILSTVNCSATVVHKVAEWFTPERLQDFPNIDGVVGLSHGLGCGMEMTGEPMELLRRTIGGYAKHPNFAAVLIIGLGCERNQLAGLMAQEGLAPNPRLHTFVM